MKTKILFIIFLLGLFISAKANENPAISMTTVKSTVFILKISLAEKGNDIQIDWGNGVKRPVTITENEQRITIIPMSNTIKIYGSGITWLDVGKNMLTSIDVSGCPDLKYFYCYMNLLTSLDVSNNPVLTGLYCWENRIESLDVSHNPYLAVLSCRTNYLASLDLSGNNSLIWGTLEENRFKLSTLPPQSKFSDHCSIAPQDTIRGGIQKISSIIDLSNEKTINGITTSYKWVEVSSSGTEKSITSGITDDGTGKFTFNNSLVGKKLRCKMTNAGFWGTDVYHQLTLVYEVYLANNANQYLKN